MLKCKKCAYYYRTMASGAGYNPAPYCHYLDETGKSPDVLENTCFKKRKTFKVNPLHLNGEKSLDRLEELEVQILELEEEKSSLEEKLSGGNSGTDFSDIAEITKQYQDISDSLEKKYERWEELASIQ